MTKNKLILALGIAIALQFFILVGEYLSAALPLWIGTEVRVKTIPVDPRSLFRGNYALLHYEFSRIPASDLTGSDHLRNGEKVYVLLKKGDDELYQYNGVTLTPPENTLSIRGRITNWKYDKQKKNYRIKYGIEAYFAPKEKALKLEKDLRDGGIAVLMISANGKAALKEVIPPEEKAP